jgi:DNA-binding transcriptional LysR family regulator
MDLRSLRYFVAVAEERHFGRAAARLHMTQPPLSRAIKQLETDVGALLLHRSPAGVTLTPAGTALYDEARALLEQAEHARARVTAAAGTAIFTIGTLADSGEEAGHAWPPGLTVVPLADMTPSRLVVAWSKTDANPLIRSLIQIATAVYRSHPAG